MSAESSVQWVKAGDRLPTRMELTAGVLFAVRWPEGKLDLVGWENDYQHDYDLMCRHFSVFVPPGSTGIGYWCKASDLGVP